MRLQIDEGSSLERERDIASAIGSGRVALEDLGRNQKKKKREETPCRDSAAHEAPPDQAAYIRRTRHTEEGLVRDNGHVTMISQKDNSLFFVHTEYFVVAFFPR